VLQGGEKGMNETLSERELSVIRLVAEGKTNQEIGKELCIATATVEAHLVRIGLKLYEHNRPEGAYTIAKRRMLTIMRCEMNKEKNAHSDA
jgi:DNA-binding NarL/FixJ family response regulator